MFCHIEIGSKWKAKLVDSGPIHVFNRKLLFLCKKYSFNVCFIRHGKNILICCRFYHLLTHTQEQCNEILVTRINLKWKISSSTISIGLVYLLFCQHTNSTKSFHQIFPETFPFNFFFNFLKPEFLFILLK